MLKNSLFLFLALSIFIHISFWGGLNFYPDHKNPPQKNEVEIEIVDLTEQQKTKLHKKMQIVDQSKNQLNDEIDPEAKYLSRFNQKVKKQTRAQKVGQFKNSSGANGQKQQAQLRPQEKKSSKKPKRVNAKDLSLQAFAPKMNFDPESFKKQNVQNARSGEASQSDDHLKDVTVGMETVLSTKEFLYYSYFNRIKDKIRKRWGPKVRQKVEKLLRSGRQLASTQDRVTKIVIVLDSQGVLERVQVLHNSGLRDLDDAAIEAFKEAAPFPNPPQGLKDEDGKVRINWDFILEASQGLPTSTPFAKLEG